MNAKSDRSASSHTPLSRAGASSKLLLSLFLITVTLTLGSCAATNAPQVSSNPQNPQTNPTPNPTPLDPNPPLNDQLNVHEGCAKPSTAAPAHTYYVDPASGSIGNDGSQAHPWNTLSEVASSGKFTTVIKPGDAIYLRNGDHGTVSIKKLVNTEFITIAAEVGQSPVLKRLAVSGSSKLNFQGLIVQDFVSVPATLTDSLVNISNSTNVIFNKGDIRSQVDVSAWTKQDWQDRAASGVFVGGSSSCVAITRNSVFNVRAGIRVSADKVLVAGNSIDMFALDGIDYLPGDGIQLSDNLIRNPVDYCLFDPNNNPSGKKRSEVCYHQDGIQGQYLYTDPLKLGQNVVIARNQIIVQSRSDLKFPLGDFQGITSFDGNWANVRIINNTAIINAYHAIAMGGTTGGLIANNTVLNTNPSRNAWIAVGPTHELATFGNITVRNNIANQIAAKADAALNIVVDHNLVTKDPSAVFKTFDLTTSSFDLHLRAGSSAIGAGSPTLAPTTDIEGVTRALPFDDGAYAYR